MRWSRIWRRSELRSKALRRTRDSNAAALRHLHYREPALIGAVGAETEQAVDAGETRGVGEHVGREARGALRARERGNEGDGVIGQRRGADRLGAVFGAVAAREGAKTGRIGRGVEAALQARIGIDPRIVPQAGAEQLD